MDTCGFSQRRSFFVLASFDVQFMTLFVHYDVVYFNFSFFMRENWSDIVLGIRVDLICLLSVL